jgi:hypothetical protein
LPGGELRGVPVRWPASRRALGATRIAVGIATAAPMAKEVSQADARFGANPSLAIVWTRDMTNDIAMAMIAGTRKGRVRGVEAAACGPGSLPKGLGSCALFFRDLAGVAVDGPGVGGCLR